jgi:DNA-directed RNA polymerase specialized sigma24 family protein
MIDELRRAGTIQREKRPSATRPRLIPLRFNTPLLRDIVAQDPSPEQQLAVAELSFLARAALAQLPTAERQLLEGHAEELSFSELAPPLGISRSWACKLHAKALASVRRSVRGRTREGRKAGASGAA